MPIARRSSLAAVLLATVVAVATACSPATTRRDQPAALRTTTTSTSTTSTSTTTTLPVAADVQELITGTTLTDRGRRAFLAAEPAIEDAATFARNCGVDGVPDVPGQPGAHTQGCYVNGRIHLLASDRPETRELLYVVAAHELLHAVYASLGPGDRARIDAELEAARAGNTRLEERLRPYGAGPTLPNEIHSILGSEFDGLSAALEAHYGQYFADRRAVVVARQRTLGGREDEIGRLKAEIEELDGRIESLKAAQEDLRAAGDIRTYNANVPTVNDLVSRYNAKVAAVNARIDEYNALLGD